MAGPIVRSIRVEGLKETARDVRQIGDKVNRSALAAAHRTLARKVVAAAMPFVPNVSGKLRKNVRALANMHSARAKAGGASVPYAPAVHWGTGPRTGMRGPHNIGRNPFLWNAVWHVSHDAVDEYAKEIQKVLDDFSRGN